MRQTTCSGMSLGSRSVTSLILWICQLPVLSRANARSAKTKPLQRIDLVQLCDVLLEMHLDVTTSKHIDFGLEAVAVHVTEHE
jgi:two-component system, OmpR family, sensor histidine kinase TctE